jgi:L-malate glycosyltransferase
MPKIAIIQKYIPQYRREFFNRLREALSQKNIELLLIYGQPDKYDSLRNDAIDLDWAIKVPNKIIRIGNIDLNWQPVMSHLKKVDLVIVEQASKLLNNYPLLLLNRIGIKKTAFWGHGKNFQEESANPLGEWIKQQVSKHVHWWFAYTESSANVVREIGFPSERITIVQNAVDSLSLHEGILGLSQKEIMNKAKELNLHGQQVGIFVGGLYPEKQLPFLLESLHLIKKQIPEFEMLFLGDGVEASLIQQAAEKYDWIHFVGSKFDLEKFPYFALSKVLLIPYTVGLVILDSFALETPLITINSPLHGPEFSYLENGINGIKVDSPCTPETYANKVVEVMQNQRTYDFLIENCKQAYKIYTLENMVSNFVNGIEKALMP